MTISTFIILELTKMIAGASAVSCGPGQFLCNNTLSNTILSINEWNYEGERCIDLSKRCDGRHDCQDGIDEHGCKFEDYDFPKHFWCYEGGHQRMLPRDCLSHKRSDSQAGDAMSSSVSETEEWVCNKMVHLNGSITRSCQKTYTGGETFASCFSNSAEGLRCICTTQLCNDSPHFHSSRTETLLILWFIVIFFTWLVRWI